MTRDLSVEQAYAAGAPVVHFALLADLDFTPEPMRLWTGIGPLEWGNLIFAGAGTLLGIGEIEEAAEIRSAATTLTLSAIPGEVIDATAAIAWQGRAATIWLAQLTPAGDLIGDPEQMARARMDTLTWTEGETATVSLTLESGLDDLDTPRVRRYTDADQQAEYPGDKGAEFVASTVEKEFTWGRG